MFSLEKQAPQQIRGVLEEQPGTGGAPGQWGVQSSPDGHLVLAIGQIHQWNQ